MIYMTGREEKQNGMQKKTKIERKNKPHGHFIYVHNSKTTSS